MVNIFYLDKDLAKSAKYTCDLHLSRGIFEAAIIFCTSRELMGLKNENGYKKKHAYHPFHQWIRESYKNYIFLYEFMYHLNIEFKYRYNTDKDHLSFEKVQKIYLNDLNEVEDLFDQHAGTNMYIAMPSNFNLGNHYVVESYRVYYFFHKRFSLPSISWKNRDVPYWYNYHYFHRHGLLPKDYVSFE